jgi:predicted dehydrogenase
MARRDRAPFCKDKRLILEKIRWGILGTARIATEHVIPGIAASRYGSVSAIASRDQAAGQSVASRLGIPRAYGSYEELLADPEVDAVYNPLPNHLHILWSVKALEAGKHVLCEKPLAPTPEETAPLLEASERYPKLKVMEAFMYKFHPQWRRVRSMVAEGAIGELRSIHTTFAYYLIDPGNIRNIAEFGGGALLDIGCYAVSVPRLLYGAEPVRVCAVVERDPQFGTDRLASALLEFKAGTATLTCGTQLAPYQRVSIYGTSGWIEVEIPFNAPRDRSTRLFYRPEAGATQELTVEAADQYSLEADGFAESILQGSDVPTPLDDAVANLDVLQAIFESSRTGGWTPVVPSRAS